MKTTAAALIIVLGSSAAKSPELVPKTFDEALVSKNTFIKFYAPWCGHCKKLAPDWDALADEYSSSSSVLIGSVDCTSDDSKELCEKYGVSGYPTLKYFKDGDTSGEAYNGARSLDALKEFVEDTLDKKCIVGSEEDMSREDSFCSDKEKEYAKKMRSKSADERKTAADRLEKMKGGSMKPELKSWIIQRLRILNGLEGFGAKEEL
eukprot:CCRYP_016164-RA/>CCRYP_016164-RA protein AED:0.06 eAED:0.06 QI:130/1/1/1/1/1/4/1615/205